MKIFIYLFLFLNYAFAQSGSCGTSCTWSYSSGTLTINGTGVMEDYGSYTPSPKWSSYKSQIKKVIIDGVTTIGNYAFYKCSSLTNVEIKSNLRSIGEYSFQQCSLLKEITIPTSLTSFGNNAFNNCTSLTSITIPITISSVATNAFSLCSSLTTIKISGNGNMFDYEGSTQQPWFYFGKQIKNVIIEEGITSIGNCAFQYLESLTNVTMPHYSVLFLYRQKS